MLLNFFLYVAYSENQIGWIVCRFVSFFRLVQRLRVTQGAHPSECCSGLFANTWFNPKKNIGNDKHTSLF